MKKCTVCKEEKPLDEFYNFAKSKDGKSWRCKTCDKISTMASRKKKYYETREEKRDKHREYKYGLTKNDFEDLRIKQDNKCASCGDILCDEFIRNHKRNRLTIDHCHETGKVRGLLCTMCNKGIGLLGDNSESVYKAYLYLKKFEQTTES